MGEPKCPSCGADGSKISDAAEDGGNQGPLLRCECGETGSEAHFTAAPAEPSASDQAELEIPCEPARPAPEPEDITEEMKQEYLANHGAACPHCGNGDMEFVADYPREEDERLEKAVRCLNPACSQTWMEIYEYKLIGIREA